MQIVRTSVASIADLAKELEEARDKAVQSSQVRTGGGAMQFKHLVIPRHVARSALSCCTWLCMFAQVAAVASQVLANVGSQSMQSVMSTGLRMLGTSVLTAVQQSTRPAGQTPPASLSSGPAQPQGTTTAVAAAVAVRGEAGTSAGGAVLAQPATATGMMTSLFKTLSTRVVEEVTKARVDAAAVAGSQPTQTSAAPAAAVQQSAGTRQVAVTSTSTQQPSTFSFNLQGWQDLRLLGGHLLNQLDAGSQVQASGTGGAVAAPHATGKTESRSQPPSTAPMGVGGPVSHPSAEEEQRLHRLCNPGTLILLKQQDLTGGGCLRPEWWLCD
jgi:hypothetical protein